MNRIVVTVGPEHTLREAARRMTRAEVGAAVVIDPDAPGPGILTERDLLHACGNDEDLDAQLANHPVSTQAGEVQTSGPCRPRQLVPANRG